MTIQFTNNPSILVFIMFPIIIPSDYDFCIPSPAPNNISFQSYYQSSNRIPFLSISFKYLFVLQMIFLALCLAVASARPQDAEPIKILKQSQEHDTESGKYSFRQQSYKHLLLFHTITPPIQRMFTDQQLSDGEYGCVLAIVSKLKTVSKWKRAESRS